MKDKKLLSLLAQQNNGEALRTAGYSLSDLRINGIEFKEWDSIIPLEKPYTRIWSEYSK